jgi:hypothetical protein
VFKSTAPTTLRTFRQQLYASLGLRQDSLFDLLDSALSSPDRRTLVRLSLNPAFRRRWPSTCDALADGSLESSGLRRLFVDTLPTSDDRPLWVIDGTHWPRPRAATSPERTCEWHPVAGQPQHHLVPAWAYQWLVAVPEPDGSWVLPLDVPRRDACAGTPTVVAIQQIRSARALQIAEAPRPVVVLDSGYDASQLAQADLDVDCLVRLAQHRVFFRAPGRYRGRGRPRLHGARFCLRDARTQRRPTRSAATDHPVYGHVRVDAWTKLHARTAPQTSLTIVRVHVERLPGKQRPPQPLWLAWIGGPLPADLHQLWRWYLRRFIVEHAFRFVKQTLGWTTVRPRHPAAADRWTWLLAAGLWQLWLARSSVSGARLPWERPTARPPTPGQVQRVFAGVLLGVGTPARPPRPRGKSPGRQPGQAPGPAPRFSFVRRATPHAA